MLLDDDLCRLVQLSRADSILDLPMREERVARLLLPVLRSRGIVR